jgi:hypothetical protein
MAKAKTQSTAAFQAKPKKARPGVHAKSSSSHLKNSKNYKKTYRGQGR